MRIQNIHDPFPLIVIDDHYNEPNSARRRSEVPTGVVPRVAFQKKKRSDLAPQKRKENDHI